MNWESHNGAQDKLGSITLQYVQIVIDYSIVVVPQLQLD